MNVAVLGANTTGRDIAQTCAVGGYEVGLHDDDATTVMDTIDVVERRLADAVETGTLDADERTAVLDRLEGTTGLEAAISDADIVIDTVTDDVGELQRRFAAVEAAVERETLVVTGRPSLSVTAAAAGLRHPDRALGLRFHQPLDVALVEVVVSDQTARTATDRAKSFVSGLGATPALVRDAPGLASERLSLALEVEAMRLVSEGVAGVETVDTVLTRGYDHPIGPLERADREGLRTRLDTLDSLAESLGERYRPPSLLADLVDAGKTGVDAGEGFYVWESGERMGSAIQGPDIDGDSLPDDPARG